MERVLLGGSLKTWGPWLALGAGALCFVPALVSRHQHDPGLWLLAAIGGALVLLALGLFARIARRRVWLALDDASFSLEPLLGAPVTTRDDEVVGLAIDTKPSFNQGLVVGVEHRMTAWRQDGSTAALVAALPVTERDDAVMRLVQRLLGRLLPRARDELARGGSLEGRGWKLSGDGLRLRAPDGGEELLRWDAISAASIVDRHVCVWRRGDERPAVRVPSGERDAILLVSLASERLAEEGDELLDAGSLGRVLFERHQPGPMRAAAGVAAIIVGLLGMLLVSERMELLSVPAFGLAGCLGVAALLLPRPLLRCHEAGVCDVRWGKERRMRYDEVARFTYQGVRHFVNGAYAGFELTLVFEPRADADEDAPIKFNARLQQADVALDGLREHISRVIAARMGDELRAGQAVAWTTGVRFLPDGLEHTPSGLFGKRAPDVIPWSEVTGFDIQEGFFHLWRQGAPKSVVQLSTGVANFFPGFALITALFAPRPSDGAPA